MQPAHMHVNTRGIAPLPEKRAQRCTIAPLRGHTGKRPEHIRASAQNRKRIHAGSPRYLKRAHEVHYRPAQGAYGQVPRVYTGERPEQNIKVESLTHRAYGSRRPRGSSPLLEGYKICIYEHVQVHT